MLVAIEQFGYPVVMQIVRTFTNIPIYTTIAPKKVEEKPKFVWTFDRACEPELVFHHHRVFAFPPEEGGSRREMRLKRLGWVGRAFTCFNDQEYAAMKAWKKAQGPSKVWMEKVDRFDGPEKISDFIGGYESFCMTIWTADQAIMDDLIELVSAFKPRTVFIKAATLAPILPYIEGTNFLHVEGTDGIAIGLTDEVSEEDLMLIKLVTG